MARDRLSSAIARGCGVLAAAAALAGCGGSGSSSTAATTTPTSTRATTVQATTTPQPGQLSAEDAAVRRLAALGKPVYCGGRHGNLVALTFDDGPGPYTHIALRELKRAGARATFFLVARSIDRFPTWPKRERALGAIGDHTMTHPELTALPFAAAVAEISGGRAAAVKAAGPPVDLFRPPYGARNDAIDGEARREGLVEVLWDVDSLDSRVQPPADFHTIAAHVRSNIRPGSIVLFHENRGQTIRALRSVLPTLKRRGLHAVTVPELLAADPPSDAQLRAGGAGCGARVNAGASSG